ncbi:hypothetical protein MPTK1_7g00520 [Marchantia polymorpha subsp. ruderalis]|uniref:Secreted protein n=2 Tax=Marchantia polymorpha TaxID=3197 RepID=A0AAF6BUS2_MARPO|nr:hypothetical protein MARPO_0046s0073 [Marchantia polymorpha]BBN15756.1 hypothetical protein Mp_7g00520 [Marchantia polymorpha subsp. ruderalis]|eukprot:PTQ39252.1 hypothetical protein MARPO_0046s0073 [Marchantia polymorpha]
MKPRLLMLAAWRVTFACSSTLSTRLSLPSFPEACQRQFYSSGGCVISDCGCYLMRPWMHRQCRITLLVICQEELSQASILPATKIRIRDLLH